MCHCTSQTGNVALLWRWGFSNHWHVKRTTPKEPLRNGRQMAFLAPAACRWKCELRGQLEDTDHLPGGSEGSWTALPSTRAGRCKVGLVASLAHCTLPRDLINLVPQPMDAKIRSYRSGDSARLASASWASPHQCDRAQTLQTSAIKSPSLKKHSGLDLATAKLRRPTKGDVPSW